MLHLSQIRVQLLQVNLILHCWHCFITLWSRQYVHSSLFGFTFAGFEFLFTGTVSLSYFLADLKLSLLKDGTFTVFGFERGGDLTGGSSLLFMLLATGTSVTVVFWIIGVAGIAGEESSGSCAPLISRLESRAVCCLLWNSAFRLASLINAECGFYLLCCIPCFWSVEQDVSELGRQVSTTVLVLRLSNILNVNFIFSDDNCSLIYISTHAGNIDVSITGKYIQVIGFKTVKKLLKQRAKLSAASLWLSYKYHSFEWDRKWVLAGK